MKYVCMKYVVDVGGEVCMKYVVEVGGEVCSGDG